MKKQHCFGCFIFVQMCARTHTKASKLFCIRSVFTIILLFTNHHPFPSSLHTHTHTHYYMQRIVRGPVAARTFAYERVFSIHFAAAAITIRHHIHSRRRRTHTHKAKQSSLHTHTHTRPLQRVRFIFEKRSETRRQRHTHIYTHIYTSCACVFFRCRFFLLARQYRENDTPLTDWVTFLSLSLCLTRCSSIHLAVFIYRSEREREQRLYLFDSIGSFRQFVDKYFLHILSWFQILFYIFLHYLISNIE